MSTIQVTSLYQGVTVPLRDIVNQIERLGWQMKKIDWRKDSYVAQASNPHGETIEKTGVTDATAASHVLLAILRRHQMRTAAQHYAGMWSTTWTDKLQQIAEAYAKAPVYDPQAAGAWRELAQDSLHRAEVLKQQIKITVVDDPEPYASAFEMSEDIHRNKNFLVSRANSQHPVWSVEENVAFRIVHDVLGHAVSGGDFGWHGENLACAAHFPLLSANAQRALFTECVGQTAYAAFYRSFGPQKVAFLDEFLKPAQDAENDPAHTGIHPSRSIAPTAMPKVDQGPDPEQDLGAQPEGTLAPHQVDAITNQQPAGVFAKLATQLFDPNSGWSSGAVPIPGQTALTDMSLKTPNGEYTDPLDAKAVMENAAKIDTGWHKFTKEDGTPDRENMKLAIVNAFRVVLLSPRKDLRWNAIHYQDIAHIHANEKDPKVYWDALEKSRQEWNVRHYGEQMRHAHLEHYKFLPKFKAILQAHYPHLHHDELDAKAHEIMYEWFEQEQSKILQGDENKPEHKQMSGDEVERKANKAMKRRMEQYVKDSMPEFDFAKMAMEEEQMGLGFDTVVEKKVKPGKYGAFMGTHLKAIAQISEHADTILDAALEDVHEHDGAGHHFRAAVLQLNVTGVGPKVCSFAWLLLQPMTSQLGTIDTHMMDVLGHDYEKEMNNRDYFKFERELAAGRDASGYSHVPLGAFQWGMWDYKRTGPGTHQDHSAMAVHHVNHLGQPVLKHHEDVDWEAKAQNLKGETWLKQAPYWWKVTEDARKKAAEDFQQEAQVPVGTIPFKIGMKKMADKLSGPIPWLEYEGRIHTGIPGQPYAHFIRKTLGIPAHDFWHLDNIALGRYNREDDSLEIAAGTPSPEVHEHLTGVLGPEPQETVSESA